MNRPHSPGLEAALASLWGWYDDYGLLPDLSADAVLVRAADGEQRIAAPRLAELLVGGDFGPARSLEEALAAVALLHGDVPGGAVPGGAGWAVADRRQIETVFDAWWLETLRLLPGEHAEAFPPGVVLGLLAGVRPMRHWLDVWLVELDGPGGQHLADLLLGDDLDSAVWAGKRDEAGQVMAWARSETVINGLTLIAGPQLGSAVVGDLLDLLI